MSNFRAPSSSRIRTGISGTTTIRSMMARLCFGDSTYHMSSAKATSICVAPGLWVAPPKSIPSPKRLLRRPPLILALKMQEPGPLTNKRSKSCFLMWMFQMSLDRPAARNSLRRPRRSEQGPRRTINDFGSGFSQRLYGMTSVGEYWSTHGTVSRPMHRLLALPIASIFPARLTSALA